MKKLIYVILFFYCTTCSAQKKDWDTFLNYFPEKNMSFLDSVGYYSLLKDTINALYLNDMVWNDGVEGKPPYILIDTVDYMVAFGSPFKNRAVYPLAKINVPHGNFMLLYGIEVPLQFISVNCHIFNSKFEHVSGFGFKFALPNENSMPLIFPEKITDTSFLVTNILAEQLVNINMNVEKWLVEIKKDGMLTVVWMRSEWGRAFDNTFKVGDANLEIRTEYPYIVEDPDGYTNLREKPTTKNRVIEKVSSGEEVTVLTVTKSWWEVKTQKGNIGYMHISRIGKKIQ